MNEDIINGIGSIGYSVSVTEWGKGYGNEIIKQGLDIARKHGLEKVLLNIDDNTASIHICENNGGILMDKAMLVSPEEGLRLVRRYWIIL